MGFLRKIKRKQKLEATKVLNEMLKDPKNNEVKQYVEAYFRAHKKMPAIRVFKDKDGSHIIKLVDPKPLPKGENDEKVS